MTVAEGGGIFVSYRRQESAHLAGRLYDRLAGHFGEDQVFIDVDAIEPGIDFADEISRAVSACQVLLTIIGPAWLNSADGEGNRRLDDPDDIVRLEIEAALARSVRVIPILMEGAIMPRRRDLPESLADLARRNALPIRHESFRSDAGRLITAIERALAPPAPAKSSGVLSAAGPGHQGSKPARNDAASALADAERIANSITDKYSRASALVSIAQRLAATDPSRAARLLTEAEHIASSITNEHEKVLILDSLARSVAVADPGRSTRLLTEAERIANSITDEHEKVFALGSVAQAVTAADPGRAARLLDEAERIANSITRESTKASALSSVAQTLAATDPGRAQRIADSITDEALRRSAQTSVARALIAKSS